jgi:hypothetical protein
MLFQQDFFTEVESTMMLHHAQVGIDTFAVVLQIDFERMQVGAFQVFLQELPRQADDLFQLSYY